MQMKRMSSERLKDRLLEILPLSKHRSMLPDGLALLIDANKVDIITALKELCKSGLVKINFRPTVYEVVIAKDGKKSKVYPRRNFYWKAEHVMNLEGIRIKCGRALYGSITRAPGMLPWHQLKAEDKRSFEKMAGVVFDVLFKLPVHEVIEFFSDGKAE